MHWDGRRIGCRPSTHNRVTKVRCGFEPHPSHQSTRIIMSDKKIKIEFAPGAFDSFDGTQEELDALVAELERMAASGELEENSVALEDWDDLDDADRDIIADALERQQSPRSLN